MMFIWVKISNDGFWIPIPDGKRPVQNTHRIFELNTIFRSLSLVGQTVVLMCNAAGEESGGEFSQREKERE